LTHLLPVIPLINATRLGEAIKPWNRKNRTAPTSPIPVQRRFTRFAQNIWTVTQKAMASWPIVCGKMNI
jgi:hypothetical protein